VPPGTHRRTSARPLLAQPLPALRARADIQGLRACAVLLVVLAHAGVPGISGGYIGVDVFFVLSGYLISAILLHEATTEGSVALLRFYARRARRILPAATVTLVVTAIAASLSLSYVRAELVLQDVAWAAFFGANIRFARQSTDYFAADSPVSPVEHFWSLAVEEQFYVAWPALLVVVLVSWLGRDVVRVRRRVPALRLVLCAIVGSSLVWSMLSTAWTPEAAYFSTLARAWELGAGALLALAGRSLPLLTAHHRLVLSLAGSAMVLWAAFTYTQKTPVPGYHLVLPVLGTVALLAAGAGVTGQDAPLISRWLGRQPLRWIGDVSYSFYLWHWPFLILPAASAGHRLGLWTNLVLVSGALLAAWVSYLVIENPIRRTSRPAEHHLRSLLLWPVAVLCVFAVNAGARAYFAYQESEAARLSANVDLTALAKSDRAPRNGNTVHNAVADAVDRVTLDAPRVSPLAQELTEVASDRYHRDDSCTARTQDTEHELCAIGDRNADRTMVLVGDSAAQMWLTPLDRIAERTGYRLVPLIKLGCSPYNLVEWKFDLHLPFAACTEYQRWAAQQLAELDPEVVIASSATALRTVRAASQTLLSANDSRPILTEGIASAVREWRETADNVRLLGGVPSLPFDAADCLSDPEHTAAECSFAPPGNTVAGNDLVRSGATDRHTRYVPVIDMFCLGGTCPTVVGDIVCYADQDHITATYGAWLTDELEDRLQLPA